MFLWSLDVLIAAACSPVVVAVPPDFVEHASALVDSPDVRVIAGGATRQASVELALAEIGSGVVVVHDAARPLAQAELVRSTIGALADADAAIAAVPVDETLKSVTDGRVVGTVDREGLWRAQTPQAFRVERLRAAQADVRRKDVATDDAMLIEKAGGRVVIVEGSTSNLKVTTPDDLLIAEAMLKERNGEGIG